MGVTLKKIEYYNIIGSLYLLNFRCYINLMRIKYIDCVVDFDALLLDIIKIFNAFENYDFNLDTIDFNLIAKDLDLVVVVDYNVNSFFEKKSKILLYFLYKYRLILDGMYKVLKVDGGNIYLVYYTERSGHFLRFVFKEEFLLCSGKNLTVYTRRLSFLFNEIVFIAKDYISDIGDINAGKVS